MMILIQGEAEDQQLFFLFLLIFSKKKKNKTEKPLIISVTWKGGKT